ncbi:MAG: hypothetical protein HY447_00485, partial [Candidatus Omnitrophica bacterium]|nr:hypothetical protein [Candidatus Omnitrophota bacterium]
MIKSMTGFARSTGGLKKGHWSVEIRSLNHRYFEFSLKTPPSLYGLEDRIRELCQTRIKRGKVTVSINEGESTDSDEIVLDEKVLRFYLSAIRKIQRRLGLKGPLSMSDVLTLPRIFSVQKKALAPESLWHVVKVPLEIALSQLLESRTREGKVLSKDIVSRLGKIEGKLTGIEKRTKNFPEEYYEKLKGR